MRKKREKYISLFLSIIFTIAFINLRGIKTEAENKIEKAIPVNWSRTPEGNGIVDTEGNNFSSYWDQYNGGKERILDKGNLNGSSSIVRTANIINSNQYKCTSNRIFDYSTFCQLLNPTQTDNVWDGKGNNPYYQGYINKEFAKNYPVDGFATWKYHSNHNGDEWRMFRGEFSLNPDQIKSEDLYIGVSSKGSPQLIFPVNDFVMVFIDGNTTDINYGTQEITDSNRKNIKFRMPDGSIEALDFKTAHYRNNPYGIDNICINSLHQDVSKHTDGWHVHLDDNTEVVDGKYLKLGNINKYLNPNITNHKIEIFAGDNAGGGAISKFEIFKVSKPNIEVSKSAYKLEGDKEISLQNNVSTVTSAEDVYYKFAMENKMNENLTNIEFVDDLLNIKVNQNGVFKKASDSSYEKVNSSLVQVKKTTANNEEIIGGLELLSNLQIKEKIEVVDKENLKYTVIDKDVDRGILTNKVVGTANYLGDQLIAISEANFSVKVKDIDIKDISISMTKNVEEIIRDGKTIYKNNGQEEIPKVNPNDEITYVFDIVNNSKNGDKAIAVDNLDLQDILTPNCQMERWNYDFQGKGENINHESFTIKPNESIKVILKRLVVPEPNKDSDNYIITNEGVLSRKNIELARSKVDVEIARPSLNIMKAISNKGLTPEENKSFTIKVVGDDNSKVTVEAIPNKTYNIPNLKYGVVYTVSEVIPMNYKLDGIELRDNDGEVVNQEKQLAEKINTGEGFLAGHLTMQGSLNNGTMKIINKKENKSLFFNSNVKKNIFKYSKDNIETKVE